MANSILDIKEILNDYSEEIQEAITEEAERIAKEGKNILKQTSPKTNRNTSHKGRYAKGWRVKTTKGRGFVHCSIYNATDWQLTHLLENGHKLKRNGQIVGNADSKPHIEPVHDKCVDDFKKGVERIVKNGG